MFTLVRESDLNSLKICISLYYEPNGKKVDLLLNSVPLPSRCHIGWMWHKSNNFIRWRGTCLGFVRSTATMLHPRFISLALNVITAKCL